MNRRRFLRFASAAAASATLSACGSSEPDERRFANQPMPTQDLGGTGQTPSVKTPRPTVTSASTMSSAQLFAVTGSASRVAVADDRAFWTIDVDGAVSARFGAFAANASSSASVSPDGSKIAALSSESTGAEQLIIVDASGKALRTIAIPESKGTPKPVDSARPAEGRIAWNAAGDQVLFAKLTGGIDAVRVSGEPETLVTAKQSPSPGSVAWSPTDDAVAFVSRGKPDASDAIFAGATKPAPVDAAGVVPPSTSQKRSIPALDWLADGKRILYTQRSSDKNDALSGDLFSVLASGGGSTLFISAGFAAPISAIGRFAVSPGGEAIAFTVLAPDAKSISFLSLWLQQLDGGAPIRLDASAGAAVTGLWWTTKGLIWREQPGSLDPDSLAGPFNLRRLMPDGSSQTIFASKSVSVATPVASPIAATPVASPVASPVSK